MKKKVSTNVAVLVIGLASIIGVLVGVLLGLPKENFLMNMGMMLPTVFIIGMLAVVGFLKERE